MLSSISIVKILIEVLCDVIIFNILYSTIDSGYGYLKNVLIYTICMAIKLIIETGAIFYPFILLLFDSIIFIIFFIVGLGIVLILNRLYNYFVDRATFVTVGILIQLGITMLLNLFI